MKQRIINQITKALNINEEYLANYIGITINSLNEYKKNNNSWELKERRLYRLNQILNILRNRKIKDSVVLKNILDNERIVINNLNEGDNSVSYINYILSQENIYPLINILVAQLKVEYIVNKLNITKSLLCGMIETTESNLYNKKITEIYIFYHILKYLNKKDPTAAVFSIFNENFKVLNNETLLGKINNKKYIFGDILDKVLVEFKNEV